MKQRKKESLKKMSWEGLQIIPSILCPKAGSTSKLVSFDSCLSNRFLKDSNDEEFTSPDVILQCLIISIVWKNFLSLMQALLVLFFTKIGHRHFCVSCSTFLCTSRHALLSILYFIFSNSRSFNPPLKANFQRNENGVFSGLSQIQPQQKSCMPQTGHSALALLGTECNSCTQRRVQCQVCTHPPTTKCDVSIFHNGMTCYHSQICFCRMVTQAFFFFFSCTVFLHFLYILCGTSPCCCCITCYCFQTISSLRQDDFEF